MEQNYVTLTLGIGTALNQGIIRSCIAWHHQLCIVIDVGYYSLLLLPTETKKKSLIIIIDKTDAGLSGLCIRDIT